MAYKRKYKSYPRRKYKKKPSLGRQLLRLSDTKCSTYEASLSSLLHNTLYSFCPTQIVTQGTTNITRIGDAMYLKSLAVSGTINAKTTAASALKARVMVIWNTRQVANITFAASSLGVTDIFYPTTTNFCTPNGIANPKASTILADMVIDINSTVTTQPDLKSYAFEVPLNQNFDYVASASTFGKRKNLFVVIIPFVVGGVTGTTASCDITIATALKFKDP